MPANAAMKAKELIALGEVRYAWLHMIPADEDGPEDYEIFDCKDKACATCVEVAIVPRADFAALVADGERFAWLEKFQHVYLCADLLRKDQYVTLRRCVDALMECEADNAARSGKGDDHA
jgi:hypothetical protein